MLLGVQEFSGTRETTILFLCDISRSSVFISEYGFYSSKTLIETIRIPQSEIRNKNAHLGIANILHWR